MITSNSDTLENFRTGSLGWKSTGAAASALLAVSPQSGKAALAVPQGAQGQDVAALNAYMQLNHPNKSYSALELSSILKVRPRSK